jgi:hypothetical protein
MLAVDHQRTLPSVLLLAAVGSACAQGADAFIEDAKQCRALEGKAWGAAEVVSTTFARPPYTAAWMNSGQLHDVLVPFCRVEGQGTTAAGSFLAFEVWLPAKGRWNGRFLGLGAGGSMGDVNAEALAHAVNRGYAAVATDNGHRSPSWRDASHWALNRPERIADFGHKATHLATVAGKAVTSAFYGQPPAYSYFYGCSQGGHKALMQAQRYAADYDGIVAGAPAYSWPRLMTQQAWSVQALTATPDSALSPGQMHLLQQHSLRRCASANGLVMDPRDCTRNLSDLHCRAGDRAECLSPEQVKAAEKLYAGPRQVDPQAHLGYPPGSESGWDEFYGTVSADGSRGGGSWLGVFRHMVFDDPGWNLTGFDAQRDGRLAEGKLADALSAESPDLRALHERRGKMLIFHGWADQQVPAGVSLEYWQRVVQTMGKVATDDTMRLFMIGGMRHCNPERLAAGKNPAPGYNLVLRPLGEPDSEALPWQDALSAVQRWVEKGQAPEHLIVRIADEPNGLSRRTVLSCREPLKPVFKGTGDATDAGNWRCEGS